MTEPILVTIAEAARVLSVGRTTIYKLVAQGKLARRKLTTGQNGVVRITWASVKALLPAEGEAA